MVSAILNAAMGMILAAVYWAITGSWVWIKKLFN